jgi:hypothetical protein
MIRAILGVLVLLMVAYFAAGQGAQPKDKKAVVKQVFDAWKERRTKVKTIRYTASGEIIVPKGTMVLDDRRGKPGGSPLPKNAVSCPKKVTMLLDFGEQRFRYERAEKYYHVQTGSLRDRVSTWTFTGKEYWSAGPRAANNLSPEDFDATVVTGNLRETAFTPEEWPLFISHGFVPTLGDHILPGRFAPKLDEKEFYYHGTAAHAGRVCTVLRTELDHFIGKSFNEYWVDMARGGAVLRQLAYVSGKPVWDLDMQYQETPAGWLVAGWTIARRSGEQTTRIYRMRVEARELDPAVTPADFQVTTTPGMKVRRIHRGGNEDSVAPAILGPNGSEQTFVVNESGTMRQTGGTPTPTSYVWWLLGGGGVAIVLLFGWWYRGRRKVASKL